ncbi:MAG: hypothetical protein AB7K24_10175 [Gemmataceae bacterium]
MSRFRILGGFCALAFFVAFVALNPFGLGGAEEDPPRERAERKPVPMPTNIVGLEIELGLNDKMASDWDGEIEISEGKVRSIEVLRGGAKKKTPLPGFVARSVKPKATANNKNPRIVGPVLRVGLEGPPTATVTINTKQGKFSFRPADLKPGEIAKHLDGQAEVERQVASIRLTTPDTEDGYPALAHAKDGNIWLAYVAYLPGREPVMERVVSGGFDELVPKGNGDQIRLVRFDGKVWEPALDVTPEGKDVWRPSIAVDGKGRIVVAWSEKVDDNWDIYYRRYTPSTGTWSDTMRVSKAPGTDFGVVAATAADGTVWLAWQGFRKDNFDILLTSVGEDGAAAETSISKSPANDWCPVITADARGNVYVAWDTYDQGNYDVRLYRHGKESSTIPVASSLRFEARPHLVCDAKDRVWIAYEEGDEQWGKDYSTNEFKKIPFKDNPGFALYINRTVRVKCLNDGKLVQPAGNLEAAFKGRLGRNKSLPRLGIDKAGGVWLMLRHAPLPNGAGEVWNSFALRHDGKNWSPPLRLSNSEYLLDERVPLVPYKEGMVTVFTGDRRARTQNREQADLYAALLVGGEAGEPAFVPDQAPESQDRAVVHPDETADVARVRGYKLEIGGKVLRPIRGEFHRHTEYSAHRDGDGLLEDSWRYALDAGNLDWMGNGDHDNGYHHEWMWWQIQKSTDLMHNPPTFVAALTHERSNVYPNGHRNVILPKRGIRPLPRGNLKGTEEAGTPDTKLLYRYLKHFGGICSSHTSGTNMGTDWRDNDPEVEPVVEIYQGHRHNYEHSGAPRAATKQSQIGGYQPAGYVWNAFEKGYRLGFQSSSDHISTHISYGVPLVEEISRQAIIDAFKKRHSYAATDNIILVVRSGDQLMGDIFTTAKRPTLEIEVQGTGPIAKVHVIRDNKYVYSAEPKEKNVKLRYVDMDAKEGTSYYYVRIEQADGNLAWASPMWITYKP